MEAFAKELLYREMGYAAVRLLENDGLSGDTVRRPAEQDAVKILAAIQRLLSCPGLSDFDLVEEIVSIFEAPFHLLHSILRTSRDILKTVPKSWRSQIS